MAKQCGAIRVTGTIDQICFYRMNGEYYARKKSSLNRKMVLRDPRFALTRVYACLLKEGSMLASAIYQVIAPEQRCLGLFRKMTGKAMRCLKAGYSTEEIKLALAVWLSEQGIRINEGGEELIMKKTIAAPDVLPGRKKHRDSSCCLFIVPMVRRSGIDTGNEESGIPRAIAASNIPMGRKGYSDPVCYPRTVAAARRKMTRRVAQVNPGTDGEDIVFAHSIKPTTVKRHEERM